MLLNVARHLAIDEEAQKVVSAGGASALERCRPALATKGSPCYADSTSTRTDLLGLQIQPVNMHAKAWRGTRTDSSRAVCCLL